MEYTKYLIHKAVLWPYNGVNGYNEITFDTAVEIDVRWSKKRELVVDTEGTNLMSNAIVHTNRSIDTNSFIYKGELDDLSVAEKADPQTVIAAYPVIAIKETPDIGGSQTIRKVYLGG